MAVGLPGKSLDRQDILEEYVLMVNLIEPDHPYTKNPYPITTNDVDYGHKKASSSKYASAGPRRRSSYTTIGFSSDKQYFQNVSTERRLAIYLHELTHITIGTHSNGSGGAHPPEFWREFGFNTHLALDQWDHIQAEFGDVSKEKLIGHIVRDEVTKYNVDLRYAPAQVRKQEMARWFESTLQ